MEKVEIESLKNELEFHKGIVEQAHVMLHIGKIVEDKYLKVVWANKFYIENCGHNIDDRNSNLDKYYEEKYLKEDRDSIAGIIKQMKIDLKPYSCFYKYYIEEKKTSAWTYSNACPYRYNSKNVLTHILIVSLFITENSFNPERLEDLQKEVNQLKYQLKLSKLSETEINILIILASGKSEKEIAEIRSRSTHTIKTHLKNIRKKLNITKNTELVKFAIETGIV